MVECTSGTHGGANRHAHANATGEGVKDTEECFCLVVGTVFVDGHKDVLVPQDSSNSKEGGE